MIRRTRLLVVTMSSTGPAQSHRPRWIGRAPPPAKDEPVGPWERLGELARRVATVAGIIASLSTVSGAGYALWQLALIKSTERQVEEMKQLTTFGTFSEFVAKYRRMAIETDRYLRVLRAEPAFTPERLDELLRRHGTGSSIYYSDEMTRFREIHEFYEELGLQVCRGALNHELVFELVTFPTDFAERTRPLCRFMGSAWFGPNRPIVGMCENTDHLAALYDRMRHAGGSLDEASIRAVCAHHDRRSSRPEAP